MRLTIIVAFLAAAALPPAVRAGQADFDQGVSVSDVLKQAKAAASADKTVIAPAYIGSSRYDRDCVRFTFNPDDKPVSDQVYLRSTEWVTECSNYGGGGTVPGPGGHPVPLPGGQNCWERPGYTYNERTQVTLRDRQKLFPWEYDKFEVCLQGPWLDIYPVATAYEYKMVQGGNRDGSFVLAPVKKIAMKPDPTGILAGPLSPMMTLTLKDKWASYYAGETTVLKLTLKKDVPNWFDPVLLEKEITLAPADVYTVDLLQFVTEFSQRPEAGKSYYVEYSFQRIGKISKPDVMKVGETTPAPYQPPAI